MNEQLQKELLKIIQECHGSVLAGLKFAKTQAPEIIRQIFFYNYILDIIYIILGLIFLIIGGIVSIKIIKDSDTIDNKVWTIIFLSFVTIIPGIIIFMLNIFDLIKLKTCPYLYLFDYVRNLK